MSPIHYTWHARSRLASLQITEAEVEHTLRHAQVTQPGTPGRRPSTVYVGEHIRVAVESGTSHVITVTLRTKTPYARHPPPAQLSRPGRGLTLHHPLFPLSQLQPNPAANGHQSQEDPMTIDLTTFSFISDPHLTLSNVRAGDTGHRAHLSTVTRTPLFSSRYGWYYLYGLCNSEAMVRQATRFTADPVDCIRCLARLRRAGSKATAVPVDVSLRKLAAWKAWEKHLLKPFGGIGFDDPIRRELAGQRQELAGLIDTSCERQGDADALTALIIETGDVFLRRLPPPDLAA